ncbi:NAD(P)-binding protein [Aureobasidium subglaciale]|nr:NAD(P)-binding protein [Aureobasidium subglaciale]
MAPTILVIGATGNTGAGVVRSLPDLLKKSKSLSNHRILCLTRTINSDKAKKLARLPSVEFAEKNWVEIDDSWLKEHHVERVFIASAVDPAQFANESQFLVNCLLAGIQYVVRISTTAANVTPDCRAFYPRNHWAIEQVLQSPEFEKLAWTSLQPNVFWTFFMGPAAGLIKNYRETGRQDTLSMMINADTPVAPIDAEEVGAFAATLLAQDDVTPHNNKKYVLNGPQDITGNQIVQLIENHIGTKVEKVAFGDVSFVDTMAEQSPDNKHLILSIKNAPRTSWEGKAKAGTTSKEVLDLCAPKLTATEALNKLLQE